MLYHALEAAFLPAESTVYRALEAVFYNLNLRCNALACEAV